MKSNYQKFKQLNGYESFESDDTMVKETSKFELKEALIGIIKRITKCGRFIFDLWGNITYQIVSYSIFICFPFFIAIGTKKMDDIIWNKSLETAKKKIEVDKMLQLNYSKNEI